MEVKTCRHCGREFQRPARCSEWKWERRVFCGMRCLHAFNAAHQTGRALESQAEANVPINERSPGDISHRCRHCGRRFWGKREQVYCGPDCQSRAERMVTAMQHFLELMRP